MHNRGDSVLDMIKVKKNLNGRSRLIGPNCPSIITPDECKNWYYTWKYSYKGFSRDGSRSGTLTYEAVAQTSANGMGQSTCIGIGGDQLMELALLIA